MSLKKICCRLCLARNAPMHVISNSPLQNVYENLTGRALHSAGRPTVACYICYSQLWKCHGLMMKAVQADELLTQVMQSPKGLEPDAIFNIDRNAYNLIEAISISPTDCFEVAASECNMIELIEVTLKDESQPYPFVEATNVLVEDVKQETPEVIEEISRQPEFIKEGIKKELIMVEDMGKMDIIPIQSDSQGNCTLQREQQQFEEGENCGIIPPIPINKQGSICKAYIEGGIKYNIKCSGTKHVFDRKMRKYICGDCGKTFSNKYILLEHRGFPQKPFECAMCPFKSINRGSLTSHLKIHRKKEIFQCTQCEKKFKDKRCFNVHLKIHNTGVKPFECTTCQRRFNSKNAIKRHLLIHTGDKQFECDTCQFRFNNKSALIAHLRKHTGERPFQCPICRKRYKMKDHLNLHQLTHTGERPFECNICKQRYSRKRILLNHIVRIHIGEKPFECKVCQQKFGARDALRSHLKEHSHNTD